MITYPETIWGREWLLKPNHLRPPTIREKEKCSHTTSWTL
nr:MAG TPA: hypothetical protein [Caudoviricetes sp.]